MKREDPTDQAVVAAVLAGDRDAFGVLVQRHQRRVYHSLWRLCGDAEEAEELAQGAFVRAYFALDGYKPEYQFSTWLFRIAYHLFLNERRDRRREVAFDVGDDPDEDAAQRIEDPAGPPHAEVEARELRRSIRRAVTALPEEYRTVIVLRHMQELSYAEIGEITGLPVGTVKSRLARARHQLAGLLGSD